MNQDYEDEPAIFGVVDKLSTRYGNTLAGVFIPGTTKLALHPFRPITSNSRDEPTEYALKDPVNIHILQPQFIFEEPILRSLLAEANSTFVTLQALQRRGTKAEYANISRTYRSIIRACIEKLQDAVENEEANLEDSNDQDKYQQYISTFYSIECIWHLCEILLDPTPTNFIVPQLLDWIRFNFPAFETAATELLLMGREAKKDEKYWPTLKSLIMHGQLDVTRTLLQCNPAAERPAFKMTEEILKSMPTYSAYGGFSIQKFRSQWEYWKGDTERKLAANTLADEPHLEHLIRLVVGETKIWNAEIAKSDCWYEYLPGYLFYTNPACKHFELGAAANDWLRRWTQLKNLSDDDLQLSYLDQVLMRLMENDMNQVIHHIQNIGDNQWFVTHLTDLLYNCGQLRILGDRQVDECIQFRNSLVFEFGSCLMARNSLWQLGIDYMEHCATEGQAALELLLSRLPIRTEKMAMRIMSIARSKGFFDTEKQICKVMSKRSFNDCRYGNALEWALRSKDAIYVTSLANFLLKHYTQTGDMLCPDVIGNIGAKMFVSPRLVFLVKYFDFYQLYRGRDFHNAAGLLVNLLDSKLTPEYFWPSLLIDAIPLLESKDPKILAKETCAILQHLESKLVPLIERTKKRAEKYPDEQIEILKDYRIENIEEVINLLRLACARNLSRAIILENTLKIS